MSSWTDRQGDVWTLGDDGLLHSPETAPFSYHHVEKKWGPLRSHDAGDVPNTARAGDAPDRSGSLPALEDVYRDSLERVEALADRLRSSQWGPAQECGLFIREAVAGTLDPGDLDAFLRGRP